VPKYNMEFILSPPPAPNPLKGRNRKVECFVVISSNKIQVYHTF
jgi:hypothetical protein